MCNKSNPWPSAVPPTVSRPWTSIWWVNKWGSWKSGGLKGLWHLGGLFPRYGFWCLNERLESEFKYFKYLPVLYTYTFPRSNDCLLSSLITTLITKALRMPLFRVFYNKGLLPVDLMLNGMQVMLVYTVETILQIPTTQLKKLLLFQDRADSPGNIITLWKGLVLFVLQFIRCPDGFWQEYDSSGMCSESRYRWESSFSLSCSVWLCCIPTQWK